MTPATLGSRLLAAREKTGLSQHEAARRAGMAQPALSRLEHAGRGRAGWAIPARRAASC